MSTTSPPPGFPPPRAVLRFAARTLQSIGNALHLARVMHTGLDERECAELELAAEHVHRAGVLLVYRFGSEIEPTQLEEARYERAEILESARFFLDRRHAEDLDQLAGSGVTLPLFLEAVTEHLRKEQAAADANAAELLEREIRSLVQGSL